jgi:uncharacterized SAM-binding protein YcdF (DUF218 family)
MYAFSHYLQTLLLPPGINLFLLLVGLVLCCVWRKLGLSILCLGFLSLYALSTPYVAYHLADVLQQQYPLVSATGVKAAQAIVVLGGGNEVAVEYGDKVVPSDASRHRLEYAAFLAQQMHLPIIVSGGKTTRVAEADVMADYLRDHYQLSVFAREDQSLTTADESRMLAPLLQEKQIKTIYLVTNAWHMPRSVFIFRCRGVEVIPAPMGYFVYGPGYAFLSFLPNMNALQTSSVVMHEFIGLAWYRWHYDSQCVVNA